LIKDAGGASINGDRIRTPPVVPDGGKARAELDWVASVRLVSGAPGIAEEGVLVSAGAGFVWVCASLSVTRAQAKPVLRIAVARRLLLNRGTVLSS
jgi:hypothetical protein